MNARRATVTAAILIGFYSSAEFLSREWDRWRATPIQLLPAGGLILEAEVTKVWQLSPIRSDGRLTITDVLYGPQHLKGQTFVARFKSYKWQWRPREVEPHYPLPTAGERGDLVAGGKDVPSAKHIFVSRQGSAERPIRSKAEIREDAEYGGRAG